MYLFIPKVIYALGLFLLTLIAGFIPLKIAKHNAFFLRLCDAFASGIFLSTALLHLIPDAIAKFSESFNHRYPTVLLICLITFILMLITERVVFIYGKVHFSDNKIMSAALLVLLLVIHSLVEGATIGINHNFLEVTTIFFAVLAHKGSESLALATNLQYFKIISKNIHRIIIIYALMTPIGIFVASSFSSLSTTNSNTLLGAIFNAIAAGTFLYLGTEHLIKEQRSFEKISEVFALVLGITLMALVAIWV